MDRRMKQPDPQAAAISTATMASAVDFRATGRTAGTGCFSAAARKACPPASPTAAPGPALASRKGSAKAPFGVLAGMGGLFSPLRRCGGARPAWLASALGAISLWIVPAIAQYNEGAGIETVGSTSIRSLTIARTIFQGECPGQTQHTITGYFVNDDLPPRPGLTLKLTNMSRGLSPDDPPYTSRTYDRGRASQSFDLALGDRHRGSFFVVREGRNLMQYEIFQAGNTIASGTFDLRVDSPVRYEYRNKRPVEVTKYNSDGKSYRTTEYRCP